MRYTVLAVCAVTALLLPRAVSAEGGGKELPKPAIEAGFREIRWGATPEEAKAAYPDLEKATPGVPGVYRRKNEDVRVEDLPFSRIEYVFRDDKSLEVVRATGEAGAILKGGSFEATADLLAGRCGARAVIKKVRREYNWARIATWQAGDVHAHAEHYGSRFQLQYRFVEPVEQRK